MGGDFTLSIPRGENYLLRHERDSNSQLYVFINHIHIYFFAEIFPTTISSLSQFRMLTDY